MTAEHPAHAAFAKTDSDPAIVEARLRVLQSAASCFTVTADRLHVAGYLLRRDEELAGALLSRLAAELCSGLVSLARDNRWYAAAAVLRQLIEVEYLAFVGYIDRNRLALWYRATPAQLRSEFTPKKMRKASGGLFADREYWLHCEMGGHPHPRARAILFGYEHDLPPRAFLLPDCVQHIRRLWTSVRLSAARDEKLKAVEHEAATELEAAIEAWFAVENELIVALDGVDPRGLANSADGEATA